MSNLKDQLIRLGSENPELRKHIKPVLDSFQSKQARFNSKAIDKAKEYLYSMLNDHQSKLERMQRSLANQDEFSDKHDIQAVIDYHDQVIGRLDRAIYELDQSN